MSTSYRNLTAVWSLTESYRALFLPSLVYAAIMYHTYRRQKQRDKTTAPSRPSKSRANIGPGPEVPGINQTHELPDTPAPPTSTLRQFSSHTHSKQPSTWQIHIPHPSESHSGNRSRGRSEEIHELPAVRSARSSKPGSKSSSKPSSKHVTRTLAQLATLVANRSPWHSRRTSKHVEEGLWDDRKESYPEKVIDDYADVDDESDTEAGPVMGHHGGEEEEEEEYDGFERMDRGYAWPLGDDSNSSADYTRTVSPLSATTWHRGGTLRTVISPVSDRRPSSMF